MPSVKDAVWRLRDISSGISRLYLHGSKGDLLTFSPVSGLDFAGRMHGAITQNYEPDATRAFATHILDAAALLDAGCEATLAADEGLSAALAGIGSGASPSVESAGSAPVVVNPSTGRFANAAAVAGPQFSLPALNAMFTATIPSHALAASAQWSTTAEQLSTAVAALDEVVDLLAPSSVTSWVQAAIERVHRIQWAGATYAAHATALAGHTTSLGTAAQAHQALTAAAHGTWLALPTMEQKLAFEQAYLTPFATHLTTSLTPSNPGFNQLLPPLAEMPVTAIPAGGVSAPEVPSFTATTLPTVVAAAFEKAGFGDLARAATPTDIVGAVTSGAGEVTPDLVEALSAGASPTHAAALASPTLSPSLAPNIGSGPSLGTMPGGGFGAIPGLGASTGAGAGANMVPRLHMPGFTRPHSAGVAGASPDGNALGRASKYGMGAPGAFGDAGLGARRAPAGSLGAPVGGSGANVNRGVDGGATSGSGMNAGSSAGARGGHVVPAGGGMPGVRGDKERTSRKVKAVTSAVERDGNIRALLGRAPALMPSVIGDNVRQPLPK
ncbi:hypothetical protein CAPI_02015 [Corynebacterium capitovis DSM 44611]|nr:hypothetical protein CAPI_02015 [Corynebacterium capitovis DSM 44611]